jgi:S1-C subfamily serine protease
MAEALVNGSGIILSETGRIATSYHLVSSTPDKVRAAKIRVLFSNAVAGLVKCQAL